MNHLLWNIAVVKEKKKKGKRDFRKEETFKQNLDEWVDAI